MPARNLFKLTIHEAASICFAAALLRQTFVGPVDEEGHKVTRSGNTGLQHAFKDVDILAQEIALSQLLLTRALCLSGGCLHIGAINESRLSRLARRKRLKVHQLQVASLSRSVSHARNEAVVPGYSS